MKKETNFDSFLTLDFAKLSVKIKFIQPKNLLVIEVNIWFDEFYQYLIF